MTPERIADIEARVGSLGINLDAAYLLAESGLHIGSLKDEVLRAATVLRQDIPDLIATLRAEREAREKAVARLAQLEPSLDLALLMLFPYEPRHSGLVSDEFVALAAVQYKLDDNDGRIMQCISDAIAALNPQEDKQ